MKRKGTNKEPPPDEAFSPDPSSEDDDTDIDDDSGEDSTVHNQKFWSSDKNTMASPTPPSVHSPSARPTRQAAQKASEVITSYNEDLPDGMMDNTDLLTEALAPMKSDDKDDHKAWVELESDPAYFSGVLKDLGVKDVKIQELFAVSIEEVEHLPQPVYGFVFLCRYAGEDQEGTKPAPQDLWFANQTMANGCATVALINIVMNQSSIVLGPTLTSFKAETAPVAPLVRGYRLDSHPFIRQAHNAFARRIEHLNADLCLHNEYEDEGGDPDAAAAKRKKQQASAAKRRHPPKKKAKKAEEDVCHYKAFLFQGGQVWVLDGLEENPVSLGPATEDTWLGLALDGINAKMQNAGELVNVLAVCRSPSHGLRAQLLDNIAQLSVVRAAIPVDERPAMDPDRMCQLPGEKAISDDKLVTFHITREELDRALADAANTSPGATVEKLRMLEAEQTQLQADYTMEVINDQGEEARAEERKQDFGAAIHKWVQKLAEKKALQGLVEGQVQKA
ncbi:hypothetical protein N0V82_010082 [Gnomoniopsis sp. IMI 355080]|nr:hypothetical protein N0V82_010082 [Gnomoniopsis sp. IMI 355080]